jgi:hypothetical protein
MIATLSIMTLNAGVIAIKVVILSVIIIGVFS